MKVLLTGSASHLAQACLPKLCAAPQITQVTGIDLNSSQFQHEKYRELQLDVRDSRLPALLKEQDALIHMAFVVLRGKMDAAEMHDINVSAGQQLFNHAKAAKISRIVHLSSASVYGSGEHLSEDSPFHPLPGFLYAQHKAELETWLKIHHPDIVCLRPHIILGPHAQPLLKTIIRLPFYIQLPDPQPRLQCLHEDDVADALLLSLFSGEHGAFNLAAADSFSLKDIIQQQHRFAVPVPLSIARTGLKTAWKWLGTGGEPAWLDGVGKTLTLDCSKTQRVFGWMPRFSSAQAIASVIKA